MILEKILKQSYERRAQAYFMAVAMVFLVCAMRMAIYDFAGHKAPYALFYGAVPIVGILGGFWPAFLTTILGALVGHFISVSELKYEVNPLDPPALIIFLCVAFILCLLCGELRRIAREKNIEADHARAEAGERVRLAQELTSMAFARTAAEERFRIAQEVSPVGFVLLDAVRDPDNNVIDFKWGYINPAAKKILPPMAETGKTLRSVYAASEDLEKMIARHAEVVTTGVAWQGEIPWNSPEFEGWLSIRTVRVDDGVAVSFSDTTQRMRLQNDLKIRNDELKEADRKKDEFLAILAHELRNPLAPIKNGLSILEKSGDDQNMTEEVRGMMGRQVDHMVRLVNDLMDVSRINLGRVNLNKLPMQLKDAVYSAVETTKPMINENGHRLNLKIAGKPVYLNGDIVRLSQAISNLLNNAAKYMDKGGSIQLSAYEENGFAVVEVKDAGIGIEREMQSKVFDMFAQSDGSLDRAQGGLGIGLSLVRNIAELHGGTVEVKSAGKAQGSTFIIRIPSQLASEIKTEGSVSVTASDKPVYRVMVVDDNEASAQTLGWAMEISGHEVKVKNSGDAALAIAKDFLPQVVLLDIGMPGMNGYELCKAMKAIPGLEQTIFIAQTGWGQEKHRQMSKEAGFDHHLVKPIDIKTLQDTVFQAGKKIIS